MPLAIVAAIAANGVIGRDNDLPWRLRTDLRRFRTLTWGKPLIVGRRNWDSIGRPLPGRETVVLTRDPSFRPQGAHVAHGWREAKEQAEALADAMSAGEVVVAGGAEIYRLALPESTILRLTEVHAAPAGDVVFPAFDRDLFRETFREEHPAGEADECAFAFVDLIRRDGSREVAPP